MNPLEDPSYVPVHKPVRGRVPPVVARWGKNSQLRWFRRFWRALTGPENLSGFWCASEHHRGPCCGSCIGEYEDGYQGGGVIMDGWCCCRDERMTKGEK